MAVSFYSFCVHFLLRYPIPACRPNHQHTRPIDLQLPNTKKLFYQFLIQRSTSISQYVPLPLNKNMNMLVGVLIVVYCYFLCLKIATTFELISRKLGYHDAVSLIKLSGKQAYSQRMLNTS